MHLCMFPSLKWKRPSDKGPGWCVCPKRYNWLAVVCIHHRRDPQLHGPCRPILDKEWQTTEEVLHLSNRLWEKWRQTENMLQDSIFPPSYLFCKVSTSMKNELQWDGRGFWRRKNTLLLKQTETRFYVPITGLSIISTDAGKKKPQQPSHVRWGLPLSLSLLHESSPVLLFDSAAHFKCLLHPAQPYIRKQTHYCVYMVTEYTAKYLEAHSGWLFTWIIYIHRHSDARQNE